MEKIVKINATDDSPEVLFDAVAGIFLLKGRSLPEDAYAFYRPLILWVEAYSRQANKSSELRIQLDYFNSSSVKQLLDLLLAFELILDSGNASKVTWLYEKGDELMEIKGMEFKSMMTKIPFELQAV